MANSEELSDISDIPYFPYEPGFLQWLIFLLLAVTLICFLTYVGRRKKKLRENQAFDKCRSEIANLKNQLLEHPELNKDILSKASLLTRRLVSILSEDISNLSPSELEKYKTSLNNPALRPLVSCILEMENYKYSPQQDTAYTTDLLNKLSTSLINYKNSMVGKKS